MADLSGHVDRRRLALQGCEVGAEIGEESAGSVTHEIERRWWLTISRQRRQADSAVARDNARHALADLTGHERVDEHGAVVVRVRIDEARSQGFACSIDLARASDVS